MKKIILTLFATIITLSAIAQTDIWYWKSGKAVKVSAVDSITFTAPAESDPPSGGTYPVLVSRGAYVVCGGNMSSNIDGSLTYYDYSTKTATQKAFQAVALGGSGGRQDAAEHQADQYDGADGY